MSTNTRKPIYAVLWTWRNHKIVPTKKAGREEMQRWKWGYEQQGWKVVTSGPDSYIATNPETGERHAVAFHEYDPETHERLWTPPKRPKPKPAEEKPHPRRGRKPVGV
jgi:hypothetical protein